MNPAIPYLHPSHPSFPYLIKQSLFFPPKVKSAHMVRKYGHNVQRRGFIIRDRTRNFRCLSG
ncbi:Hypothetical protein, putative [Bodo saltans]|uniref:Uncharacterized protein n=1 Tax=Bodo saltans TaxID=75058 RepID=A0A0S4IUL4_BODSA|nr:Hypothetical protein, putative [Bodo saltans]|eukprot:CUE94267.1 Hypothetical protein, putative [Bodo saltans]